MNPYPLLWYLLPVFNNPFLFLICLFKRYFITLYEYALSLKLWQQSASPLPMNAWQQILKCVENKLNKQTYTTWFKPTQFQSLQADNTLHVTVPNRNFESWMVEHFSEILEDAARESHFEDLTIRFHAKNADHPSPLRKFLRTRGNWISPPMRTC